jgi:hypothetical protein
VDAVLDADDRANPYLQGSERIQLYLVELPRSVGRHVLLLCPGNGR